jgi:hypothetical protein
MNEYAKISAKEKSFGHKRLLEAQLSTLHSVKRLRYFLKLRKQEMLFKLALKSKIKETREKMRELNKTLPKMPDPEDETQEEEIKEEHAPLKSHVQLEEELEIIKQKLSRIQD